MMPMASLILAMAALFAQEGYVPVNRACPVDGSPVRPGWTLQYNGLIVGLCGSPCRSQFLRNPKAYIANVTAPPVSTELDKVAPGATGPCDLKRVRKAAFCKTCDRELGKDDARGDVCKKCQSRTSTVEICVRRVRAFFRADCHPEKTSDKPVSC